MIGTKIHSIEDLAAVCEQLRGQGKKIVQCHGVFDLLHIGHVKYLQAAHRYGDVLVVTVTTDDLVNKGPERPAFNEQLRMEALAALECVDYVAVSRWPTAVDSIRMIRPDFYVKGSEYRKAEDDRTGGIVLEREAVESTGGAVVLTDEVTFSSSALLNRNLSALPRETTDYIRAFAARHSSGELAGVIERTSKLRVLVVGDTIIDEYQYVEALGKSSKEPMLAARHVSTEMFAGGILAVANHVANFAHDVGLVTFLGSHDSQAEFILQHLSSRIQPDFLTWEGAPTIVKRRFIEGYSFTKLLEIYEMSDEPLPDAHEGELMKVLERRIDDYDLVLVVDFGHGMMTPPVIDLLTKRAKFLAVNAQSNAGNHGYHTISRYPRADYVCIAEHEIRLEARDRRGDLRGIIRDVSKRLNCPRVVVTRGRNGCLCYDRDAGFVEVPAVATQVVDRVGAGDAFISISSMCAAQGAPMEVLAMVGNAGAAQAVATVGHQRSIELLPLIRHLEALLK
jgi:rfaE bifunctional protein kinase chain/domain/rfaE bifunctional protein nucleotidyltransferase chain/domain